MMYLYWVSGDKQAACDGGLHAAPSDEEESAFLAELHKQCGSDDEHAGIEAGSFRWIEEQT